jgi:hypothetical protein
MQKLALGALVIGLFVACGGGNKTKTIDSGMSGSGAVCDPIAQTGCTGSDSRCTWVQDTASVGHVDCVPAGTAALGGACMAGSAFPSYDNCDAGSICINTKCETICDNNAGGSACGSGFACGIYSGVFEVNGSFEAGACDKTCDPFNDNSFGSGGSGDLIPPKTGTTCGSDQGCYGFPSSDATNPTHFTCGGELNTDLVHRSACAPGTGTDPGCAPDATSVYLNGCAQGYIPLLDDMSIGVTTAVCIAYCMPNDCYMGMCGSDNLASEGSGAHQCLQTDIRVDPTEPLPTGSAAIENSCIYSWVFEEDTNGNIAETAFDNTVGFCYDHSKYRYDSNGNNMIDSGDAFDPPCSQLPGSGSDVNAVGFGCVSTTTAEALGELSTGSGSGSGLAKRLVHERPLGDMPRFTHTSQVVLQRRMR